MVTVRFKGGMGNQLFQYAFGRAVAARLGAKLVFDPTNLLFRNAPEGFVYRNYDLDVFRLPEPDFLFSPKLLAPLYNLRVKKLSALTTLLVTRRRPVVSEPYFHYAPEVLAEAREGVIYDGWWQSPKYFAGVEREVREALGFRRPVLPESQELLKRIETTNAVCLNVRRTDFLRVDTLNATDKAYFLRGVDFLAERLDDPYFFIFSDDVAWCREELKLDHPSEVVGHEHKGHKFGNYLQLMTRCRHYLIPNSSFAWWAAWLNTGPEKTVVAPRNWFTNPAIDTSDLVPPDWHRL